MNKINRAQELIGKFKSIKRNLEKAVEAWEKGDMESIGEFICLATMNYKDVINLGGSE